MRYTFADGDRVLVERLAAARFEEWNGRTRSGDYVDTIGRHYVGACGELALARWITSLDVENYDDDAPGSQWDRLTPSFAFEIKTRQAKYADQYGYAVHAGTVESFGRRAPRQRQAVVWGRFEGHVSDEARYCLAVTLTGWATRRDVEEARREWTTSTDSDNACHVVDTARAMSDLGAFLRRYDGGPNFSSDSDLYAEHGYRGVV
jgi:hypothetical protein